MEKIKRLFSRLGLHFSVERIHAAAARVPADRIFLLERVMDIKPYMEESLAVICPFVIPHAAKAALEAGFLGRTAVLADWPEAREYLDDGQCGILVPPGNVSALARAMKELVEHPETVDVLERKAKEYVANNFSKAGSMVQILKAYIG